MNVLLLTHKTDQAEISKLPVPRFSNSMDIYVNEEGSQKRQGFVARVNLGRLGPGVNMMRYLGTITTLYVVMQQ